MKKFDSKNIRNVCLVGHIGSGKTSLGEAILFSCGTTTRLGSVLDGTSTFDFEPEEIKRQSSISTAFAFAEWKKHKIQIIDTSGDTNFYVDARNGVWAADIAITVISAVDGVEVMTEKMFEAAQGFGIPGLVVINKMDRERANFQAVLAEAQECLSRKIAPLFVPIGKEDSFTGVVDVLKGKAYRYAGDGSATVEEGPVPDDLQDEVAQARETLIETIAESDDALMEKYLETMELTDEEVARALPRAIASGLLIPAVAASATQNVGVASLLDLLVDGYPSPLDLPPRKGMSGDDEIEVPAAADAPFAGFVFKTVQDKFTGSLAICRVVSGTIAPDGGFLNATKGEKERYGQLLGLLGKKQESMPQAVPGDIVAFAKLKNTKVGDSICAEDRPVVFEPPPAIHPVLTYAVAAKDKNEEDKLGQALNRIAEEDPTIHIIRNKEVKQTQIAGMGQVHIDMAIEKIKRLFDIDVELLPPRIPYRETIRKKVSHVEGKHKKQSGGRGQFGVCYIDLEPNPGKGFEFVNAIVGGAIPKQWIPSVEKGIVDRMAKGVIAGYPVVDVKVTLVDGKYHDVDSSDAAFQMAGSKGFKAAAEQADPYLLEPIWNLEVICPDECMGDVMGDISSRRGKVLGMEAKGKNQVVRAQVPMAELLRYAPDLKSLTGGRGTFTVSFSHYEQVPPDIQAKVVAEYQEEEEE